MKSMNTIYTGLLVLGLLFLSGITAAQENTGVNASETMLTGDIEPYNGPIGADSPLYGLKIALEDMDESFTANETERINKEMDHARLRLSEFRRALENNESGPAQEAIENYLAKVNLTNETVSRWSTDTTGLLHAQEMIVRHQAVLENLLETHPGNKGLQRAFSNSLELENRFMVKTALKIQRYPGIGNMTTGNLTTGNLTAAGPGLKEQNRTHLSDEGANMTPPQTGEKLKGWEKNNDTAAENGRPVGNITNQSALSGPPGQWFGPGQGTEPTGRQNENIDNQGRGNSRNK